MEREMSIKEYWILVYLIESILAGLFFANAVMVMLVTFSPIRFNLVLFASLFYFGAFLWVLSASYNMMEAVRYGEDI